MLPPVVAESGCCKESRIPGRSGLSAHIRFIRMNRMAPSRGAGRVGQAADSPPGEPRRSRPTLVSPPAVVAGAQPGKSMQVHRQTNGRRVSDAFVRTMLRERVRNRLPIDAETVRSLGIACGSDRLSRLRREVLRELEKEFALVPELTVGATGAAAAPASAMGGRWRSPVRVIRQSADLRRPCGGRAAHPMRRPFRSGVVAICSAILRRLMATVHHFPAQANAPAAD